jgi:hypothetical protein
MPYKMLRRENPGVALSFSDERVVFISFGFDDPALAKLYIKILNSV